MRKRTPISLHRVPPVRSNKVKDYFSSVGSPCKHVWIILLGEQSKKEMSQIVEKVHKGGGGQSQNQNSLHFKCRLLFPQFVTFPFWIAPLIWDWSFLIE